MEDDSNYRKLIGWGISYVSLHLRSEKEITTYIQKRAKKIQATNVDIDKTLTRLRELGYIDDEAYAKRFIDSRQKNHQKGERVVRLELGKKGVLREIVDSVYAAQKSQGVDHEKEAAQSIVQKKYSILSKFPIIEQKRRVFGLLQRRGFASSVISRIIDEMFGKQYN